MIGTVEHLLIYPEELKGEEGPYDSVNTYSAADRLAEILRISDTILTKRI